jgi:ribosomal protein L37AE/L43A
MSKHVCPKCHKAKKAGYYARHIRKCVPCARDLQFLAITKSGSFNKTKNAA